MKRIIKILILTIVSVLLILFSLVSGAIIEKYGIFPITDRVNIIITEVDWIESNKAKTKNKVLGLSKGEVKNRTLFSNNYKLELEKIEIPSQSRYGGIETLYGKLFFMDGDGIGWLDQGGSFKRIISDPLPINKKDFQKDFSNAEANIFGVKDILITSYLGKNSLLVSSNNYDKLKKCYFLSIFQKEIFTSETGTTFGPWVKVFDTKPCLKNPDGKFVAATSSGGRIVSSEEGEVYFSTGDFYFDGINGEKLPIESDYSKVIKLRSLNEESKFIAYGVRNPQGLVAVKGGLFETEHGPQGGDELNYIDVSTQKDYGWPDATFGVDYGTFEWPLDPKNINHESNDFTSPKFSWIPSIGVSNLIKVLPNSPFKVWQNNLIVGAMRDLCIYRLILDKDNNVIVSERINLGFRVRDIIQRDSGIYFLEDASVPAIWRMLPSN